MALREANLRVDPHYAGANPVPTWTLIHRDELLEHVDADRIEHDGHCGPLSW